VEGGLVNLCFIVNERSLKSAAGDPAKVVEHTLMSNPVARERLQRAESVGKWHSAGPLTFGRRRLARGGVVAIGDASGMIDPFTGTGIQMALRTGEIAAEAIIKTMGAVQASGIGKDRNPARAPQSTIIDSVLAEYSRRYETEFHSRMRVAGLLRAAAFSPGTASVVASVLTRMPRLTNLVMRATRSGNGSRGGLE
jgi:flavin-dependent dehydrogenase